MWGDQTVLNTTKGRIMLRRIAGAVIMASTAALAVATAGPATAQSGTVRTFEQDAVGSVPAGCTTPTGATAAGVSDVRGYDSAQSLRLEDASATATTVVQCPDSTQAGADFGFDVYPASLASGFQFTLLGHLQNYPGAPRSVFHLNVTPQGELRWYDNAGWTQVAPPGTVALSAWSHVRLQVLSDQAAGYVYVNGHYVGQGGPWGVRQVADITGYQFSSAGSATTGDDVFFDNVAFGGPQGSAPHAPQVFGVGNEVTIAQSDTPVQMPNTAVTVHVNGQEQTLVSYPAHTDASQTAGNVMAVSTDRGHTWSDAQARNPIPDAPSYGLTRLRNGDVLAVDYHTYMTPDSGNLQAEVPTAISHDGGMTWTQRAGTMTAPQAMRNISSVTDRPGSPLGGFVLVHSVVEDPDGTLHQSGYGYYADDKKYRQIVMTSTDEGANWTIAATVAYEPNLSTDPRFEGPCEGAIARVADGSLLIVMRTGSYQPMYTSRSTDGGATWSPLQKLVAGPAHQPVVGIYPTMTLMGNGQLVLWIGRPGQRMLASPDGTGRSWTSPQEIDYRNSGNGATLAVDANHLLVFGDRGANWSFPTPAPYGVWSRMVTVARPGHHL
jgi:hypothetical protein